MWRLYSVRKFFPCCILILLLGKVHSISATIKYDVTCTNERMLIEVEIPDFESEVYLDNLKYYPEIGCHPTYKEKGTAVFDLSLVNFSLCGITRITHQLTGTRTFHHRVIVEGTNELDNKERINVRCTLPSPSKHNITRREVLPAGFKEQEDIESTTTLQTNAPVPMLNVSVKQGNSHVNGELNVKPGTPLTMEIYLDDKSAPIYGLLVSFMRVSDTKSQEETIIFNGCSVDPYLFENFNTVDGDQLTAKFRAFKFPETSYVQFTGTVSICLDKCRGVECSNGQVGYGRRKREISGIPYDPKKVFEVTLTTYLKVDYKDAKESSYRHLKEKRFSKDEIPVLKLNQSHKLPLDDLFDDDKASKSEDDSVRGNRTYVRARNEDESFSTTTDGIKNSSTLMESCFFTLLLTYVLLSVA